MRSPGRTIHAGFALVLFLLGFLVSSGFVQERLRERELPERRRELVPLVRARERTTRALALEVAEASERFAALQREASRGSGEVAAVLRRLGALRGLAGVDEVRGPGIVVELSDSDRAAATRAEVADLRIQDVDLQSVVNELWAAGAEAVSVNGRRVVATTAIRAAGGAILVNYGAISPPYRVAAIGDPDALLAGLGDSEVAERFSVWTQVYGLGFSVEPATDLVIPGLPPSRQLQWARPA